MSLIYDLCQHLRGTDGSIALRESVWVYPFVEIAHVLSIVLFFGMIFILDARIIGKAIRQTPVTEVQSRLFMLTIVAFSIAANTGLLLVYSDPVAMYENIFFRIKLLLLALAGINMLVFHFTIFRTVADWDTSLITPRSAVIGATLSLFFWSAIVFSGRFIAFAWILD